MSESKPPAKRGRPKGGGDKKQPASKRQQQVYTDEVRAAAIAYIDFLSTGKVGQVRFMFKAASDQLHIPIRTLREWYAGKWVGPDVQKMRVRAIDSLVDRQVQTIDVCLMMLALRAHEAKYHELYMAPAIGVDKIKVLLEIRDRLDPPLPRPEEKPSEPVVAENPYEPVIQKIIAEAKADNKELTRAEAIQKIIEYEPSAKEFLSIPLANDANN